MKRLALILCLAFAAPAHEPHAIDIVVRPTDIDVKGHVNNAKYVEYLQWSRWDWLDERGLTNDRLIELETTLVVANISIDYRSEARQGERLKVSVSVEKIGEKSFTVRQAVLKQGGDIASEARVVMVAVNPETRKSRPLPDELRAILEDSK
jgi:YbgC/YbaW family acyl-CoA thioester hydrolase